MSGRDSLTRNFGKIGWLFCIFRRAASESQAPSEIKKEQDSLSQNSQDDDSKQAAR